MAPKTALEQLDELQANFDKQSADLKKQAIGELSASVKEKKAELKGLEDKLEKLTGKKLISDGVSGTVSRAKPTYEEIKAIIAKKGKFNTKSDKHDSAHIKEILAKHSDLVSTKTPKGPYTAITLRK